MCGLRGGVKAWVKVVPEVGELGDRVGLVLGRRAERIEDAKESRPQLEGYSSPRTSSSDARRREGLARAGERWGLNSVEVLNSNNRTTVGSANNNSLTLGIPPER